MRAVLSRDTQKYVVEAAKALASQSHNVFIKDGSFVRFNSYKSRSFMWCVVHQVTVCNQQVRGGSVPYLYFRFSN